MKRTKIVCTIGPATASAAAMEKLVRAGMNVARLNFSHGSYAEHTALLKNLRAISKKTGQPLTILQDLQGPKVRVGELPKEGIELKTGATVVFTTGKSRPGVITVGYPHLHKDVKAGERVLLDDGLLEIEVVRVKGQDIEMKVIVGGILTSHKGMNFPSTALSLSAISKKDREDLVFGVKMDVDVIALSFVRSPADVVELRRLIRAAETKLKKKKKTPIAIIAKIEKNEALQRFDEILAVVDAIMVARGDLAVETPAAEVPMWQKKMVQKCVAVGKPVIVATQMLDSMIRNPRPTRAEISDVANAIIDHTDAVMLSGETAAGKYPIEAVTTMATIAIETERSVFDDLHLTQHPGEALSDDLAIAQGTGLLARTTNAVAIVGWSTEVALARQLSRFRPEIPMFLATDDERALRQMNLSWGTWPFFMKAQKDPAKQQDLLIAELKKHKVLKRGQTILYVSSASGVADAMHSISIVKVG